MDRMAFNAASVPRNARALAMIGGSAARSIPPSTIARKTKAVRQSKNKRMAYVGKIPGRWKASDGVVGGDARKRPIDTARPCSQPRVRQWPFRGHDLTPVGGQKSQ